MAGKMPAPQRKTAYTTTETFSSGHLKTQHVLTPTRSVSEGTPKTLAHASGWCGCATPRSDGTVVGSVPAGVRVNSNEAGAAESEQARHDEHRDGHRDHQERHRQRRFQV